MCILNNTTICNSVIRVAKKCQKTDFLCKKHFFFVYLATPRPTLDHYCGDSHSHLMGISALFKFRSEVHQKPRNEVGSLSQAPTSWDLNREPFGCTTTQCLPHKGNLLTLLTLSTKKGIKN